MAKTRSDDAAAELDPGMLHDLLGHLLRHAFNKGQAVFAEVFAAERITPLQFMMLELISRNPGVTHSQIQISMGTSASVVTTALKPLVMAGHVAGTVSGADKRRVCYRLTETGDCWFTELRPKISRCEDQFAKSLTPTQRSDLAAMLCLISGIDQPDKTA
ncbi:MAG: MarR family transcriptional regulator [Alphaproteobacteria bacterium]|nr:MarR family transcriptional regulator [Alphaproteobacteria bacterium]